jgi:16S rRNA (cytosine967-C5)-methyltransferase
MHLGAAAAPGGKTTMLAQLMGDRGTVVALDRTQNKVRRVCCAEQL